MEEARLRAGAGRASLAAARLVRLRLGSAGRRSLAPRSPGTRERARLSAAEGGGHVPPSPT